MRLLPYDHVLLADYASTLDALPLDVAKNIADLRELDGVLNNSMIQITQKLNALTDLLEDAAATPEMRYSALVDVAEEAARLKLGTDDKIRVVTQTADLLQSQRSYLDNVLKQVALHDPAFAPSRNTSKTSYPTLVFRPFANPSPLETGRRRRAQAGNRGFGAAGDNPTPAKRRRTNNDDTEHRPAARRDRDTEPAERNGRRRAASPAESIMSMHSHQQMLRAGQFNGNGNGTPRSRARPPAQGNRNGQGTPHGAGLMDAVMNGKDAFASPGGPAGFAQQGAYGDQHFGDRWENGQGAMAGPGGAAPADQEGDGDGDQDERTYCYCDTVSYGDMIACDGDDCPREWFHLACTGLSAAPKGSWFCDECVSKRDNKRNRGRNTKRRAGGASRGARAKPAGTPS